MLICLFAITALTANAQKYALLDMEYVLKNIPAYERANEQLNQVSKKWQAGGAQHRGVYHVQEL